MIGGGGALELADWRRQVAELYADVRRMAVLDPKAAHVHWRTVRERLYRDHPQSPVPRPARSAFRAMHFPYEPALRFEVPLLPAEGVLGPGAGGDLAGPSSAPILPSSRGDARAVDRVAWLDVPFPAGPRRLALYWVREYAGGLLLPFADATGGHETYPAGRYLLDTAKGADLGPGVGPGTIVLDFNFAFQPSCAFDPSWACPLAPAENRLDVEVRAGERMR